MTDIEYQKWIDKLVSTSIPLDIQTKIATLQPLTKAEAQKFVDVVSLVSQTKLMDNDATILAIARETLSVTKSIRKRQLRDSHSRPLPRRGTEGDIWCYKKWMLLKSRSDLIEPPATKEKVYNYLLEHNDNKKQLLQYGVYVLPDFISAIDNGRKSENAWF